MIEPRKTTPTPARVESPQTIEPGGGRGGQRLAAVGVLLVAVAAGAFFYLYEQLRASLPRLEGEVEMAGLGAAVTVERDGLGIPTITGSDRADVARALGFVHAQDRFFQMDLLRRQAAGELAGLLGDKLLPVDRKARVHRFRARAAAVLDEVAGVDRALLDAYVAGVNAGLAALDAPPWEYLVLRRPAEPWRAEDTVLSVYSMYFQLNDENGARESARGLIHDLLGPEVFALLAPPGDPWDAPVDGEPYPLPPLPGPASLDLRRQAPAAEAAEREPAPRRLPDEPPLAGSNNWAVAGTHTADGRALVANDMHLPIRVPHVWYRASLVYPDGAGGERRISGVTLPGTPAVVVGSNGRVAWGFTNTYGDWVDLVVLEPDPADPEGGYLAPGGPLAFTRHRERLLSAGGADESLEVLETIWGPVIDRDHLGRRRALRWIAHDPPAVSFEFLALEAAADVEEAVAIANRIGAPPQNFVVGDDGGRIGWTVLGPIPRRFGHNGRRPSSWAAGDRGWDGYLEPGEYPKIVDPPGGRLWTANGRVTSGEMMRKIGVGTYAQGARAGQIRDRLRALDAATLDDMLAIQLDDEALFLARWRELLLEALDPEALADAPPRAELRRLVEEWGGHAAVDSAGYRLVRAFRLILAERLIEAITAPLKAADEEFDYLQLPMWEGPVWRLVEARPEHLLPPEHESWDGLLLAVADETIAYFDERGGELAEHTWGARNTTRIQHPFSQAMPFLSRWLDMPPIPLPGDSHMPRYQGPVEGASERLAVSPGREEEGYLHMPVGQSGHLLSPHYGDSHAAWASGEPTPFLPGPTVHTLTLVPARAGG